MLGGPELFPTPSSVGYKMLAKISKDAVNFLDPEGGRGDLADLIRQSRGGRHSEIKIDCIESDPNLVLVLRGKDYPVVGYDWLDYSGVSYYDAIVMNPPFSNGDEHLMKAWEFMYDGEIVCLLNAETLRNPYTKTRQRLAEIIRQHGQVEELGACFSKGAVRATDVEVVMVYLRKTSDDDRVDLWANVSDEKPVDVGAAGADPAMLAIPDNLGNMEHYYNMANTHMLTAFQHLRKAFLYMEANHVGDSHNSSRSSYEQIVAMALKNVNPARAEFGRKHRRDAWMTVFNQMEFHRWLDKKQREELLRDVEKNSNIPFTAANIKGTLQNVLAQRQRLFEQSVANVFDSLTKFYNGNGQYREGWKTNDSYKVNMKLIFPYGCAFDHQFCKNFSLWRAYSTEIDVYNDLDRVLAVMDGKDFEEILTIGKALDHAFQELGHNVGFPFNNKCSSRYFDIKFWKKGTVHLKFKRKDLWEQFNITASAGKRWLGEDTRNDHSPGAPAPAPVQRESGITSLVSLAL